MKPLLVTLTSVLLLCGSVTLAGAADNELVVLDENTFIKIDHSDPDNAILQLYKVTETRINLVDAIQINEQQVNFKKRFEYRRLKIDEKE